jgi:hypothetical protein
MVLAIIEVSRGRENGDGTPNVAVDQNYDLHEIGMAKSKKPPPDHRRGFFI